MSYPADVTFHHQEKSSRWWALATIFPVKMFLLIPHLIFVYILNIVVSVFVFVGILGTLLLGEYPNWIERLNVGFFRWAWKFMTFLLCMTDKYPSFSFKQLDGDRAGLSFEHQEKSSRLWALLTLIPVKFILLIPHYLVMIVLQILAFVCSFLGIFVTLFTGKYPESFANAITTAFRYNFRVMAYHMCMTDKYPPISWK